MKIKPSKALLLAAVIGVSPCVALAQFTGQLNAHDPSTLTKQGSTYIYFATGDGIVSRTSTDRVNWSTGPVVFPTPPAWTTQAVPAFTGTFWAPDVAYFNGLYHLYYSVSSWGSIDSAIGVATTPSLTSPVWTDKGKVVQSDTSFGPGTDTTSINTIDPSLFVDTDNRVYLTFGSYFSGIVVTEIEPTTGKRKSGSPLTTIANNSPGGGGGGGSGLEASALIKHGTYYYLFVNEGTCCSGIDSTYRIRMGRSTSPTGPFLDQNGVNLANGGGTLFLDDDGERIGPGHFSLFSEGGQDGFGYHYYNGDADGSPTYGLRNLYWTADAWPSYAPVNPKWTGASSVAWSNTGNWSGATTPDGVGHVANFAGNSFNRYQIGIDGNARTLGSINFQTTSSYTIGTNLGLGLTLDAQTGYSATLNVSAGNHTLAAPLTVLDTLAVNVTLPASTLTVSGAVTGQGLRKHGYGTLTLSGTNNYNGSVLVRNGTLNITGAVTASQYTSIGPNFGDEATLIVRTNGSLSVNADLNIGDNGSNTNAATGTLELRDNASITVGTAGGFFVASGFGSTARAVGTVNQTGGTLNVNGAFDGAFIVGGRNSAQTTGTYNQSGGTINANTNVRIGGKGTGTFNQSGGTFNTSGYLSIGRLSGATGVYAMTGGTLNQTNTGTRIIVGETGTGTLSISGTSQVVAAGILWLGQDAAGVGTLSLNGGTLTAPGLRRGSGAATLALNGGTLRASAANANFLQSITNASVGAGGAILDTQSFAVSILGPLSHDSALGGALDGGLKKLGDGSLTLSSTVSFTGPVNVQAGSLVFAANQSTARGLSIAGGANASIASAGTRVVALSGLSVATGGSFNLNNNAALLGFTNAIAAKDSVRQMIVDGRITSATGGAGTSIGFAELSDLGLTSWNGVASPGGGPSLVIRSTSLGDANLDGAVNFDDLLRLAQNYGATITSPDWFDGDFTNDGAVNFDDLLALSQNYGATGVIDASFSDDWALAQSLVPEPASVLVIAAAISPLRRRHRVEPRL